MQAVDLATTTLIAADRQCSPKAAYTPLLPGVLDFLTRLKQAQLKVIMVSADAQQNLEQFVQYYSLQTYFDQLQGVNSQHPTKTAPNFLAAACQSVGLSAEQGIVIGDAASDLRMAASARGFIGYLGGWQPALSITDILGKTYNPSTVQYGFATDFSQIDVAL
jgi:phosphoglycolate phosphatase